MKQGKPLWQVLGMQTIQIDGQTFDVHASVADEIAHLRTMVRRLSEELAAQQAEAMQREDTIAQILKSQP